jgi:hypothetical protein
MCCAVRYFPARCPFYIEFLSVGLGTIFYKKIIGLRYTPFYFIAAALQIL